MLKTVPDKIQDILAEAQIKKYEQQTFFQFIRQMDLPVQHVEHHGKDDEDTDIEIGISVKIIVAVPETPGQTVL